MRICTMRLILGCPPETKRGKFLSLYSSPEAFRSGMQGIVPQDMTVKEGRVSAYRQGVDGKAEVMVEHYRRAMFE